MSQKASLKASGLFSTYSGNKEAVSSSNIPRFIETHHCRCLDNLMHDRRPAGLPSRRLTLSLSVFALRRQLRWLTESQVDDDVVPAKVVAKIALRVREQGDRDALKGNECQITPSST